MVIGSILLFVVISRSFQVNPAYPILENFSLACALTFHCNVQHFPWTFALNLPRTLRLPASSPENTSFDLVAWYRHYVDKIGAFGLQYINGPEVTNATAPSLFCYFCFDLMYLTMYTQDGGLA